MLLESFLFFFLYIKRHSGQLETASYQSCLSIFLYFSASFCFFFQKKNQKFKTLDSINTFFNLILDFPSSLQTLKETRSCIQKLGQKQQLLSTLEQAIIFRLCQPAASTQDITLFFCHLLAVDQVLDLGLKESVWDVLTSYLK